MRLLKNRHIVAVRFIGLFIKASFINETSTKNHFITTLLWGGNYPEGKVVAAGQSV